MQYVNSKLKNYENQALFPLIALLIDSYCTTPNGLPFGADIPEYGENKINAAFAFGSSELDEDGEMRGAEGGASLLIAGLIAEGETEIDNCDVILRGYGNLVEKLSNVGAKLEITE